MTYPVRSPKKLIEVALPLDAINAESVRRKQKAPRGWPTSFHKWWAQRPIAAARAVLFAQLVNDPGYQQGAGFRYGKNKKEAAVERQRLFSLIEKFVLWDNSSDRNLMNEVRKEIQRSWQEVCDLNREHPEAHELFDPSVLPLVEDPFSGSGTIPLEAQRLGLSCGASDLNPVAVTINKALMELPRVFRGLPPVRPTTDGRSAEQLDIHAAWPNATGLAKDVEYYGEWLRNEAERRIGHFFPVVTVTDGLRNERPDLRLSDGMRLVPVAWIWTRTVGSPNPAFRHVHVPLASTFVLSTKAPGAYVDVSIAQETYKFTVRHGKAPASASKGTKAARAHFRCLLSGVPIEADYIRSEAQSGRMGARLMAVVVDSAAGRFYLSPTAEMEAVAREAKPTWAPEVEFFQDALGFRVGNYGMAKWSDLFTDRQLTTLSTFSSLVSEARERCKTDALAAGRGDDGRGLAAGGTGATAYAEAISVYLAMAVDRMAFYGSTLCGWLTKDNAMGKSMPQQALMMSWDFAEGNPFGKSSADALTCVKAITSYLELAAPNADVSVSQRDARTPRGPRVRPVVSTDPPYFDNIGYADLSDFFYVWLRHSLKGVFPGLFATVSSPKADELVATPARHGGRERAEAFFLDGMLTVMRRLSEETHPAFPITIYYAFKQSESSHEGTTSTGWDTFLAAVINSGLMITGTWPLRTEGESRMRASESNALASSIVVVCRRRPADSPTTSRREFLRELNIVLPDALDDMTRGRGDGGSVVAPVDLSQAIIGPGMAIFSKYRAVLEADGSSMSVKMALQLINRFLAEDDFDHDTQFCLHWFDQHEWDEGAYGDADVLARAKATSVGGLAEAGVLRSGAGKVRLLRPSEYPSDWDPRKDSRIPIWEALHQLIRALREQGESGAGQILAAVKDKSEAIRQLAYRLYTLCERRGRADDARAYNELVTSWSAIESAAGTFPETNEQLQLFGGDKA